MTTTAVSGGGEGGCPSPQDPPLLSQDEFFRHLNLQSVHQKRGKYHYRQALKERLRASSLAKSPPSATKKPPLADNRKSPQVSPCKFLSEAQRRKLFGRPKIRQEKVAAPGAAVVAKTNSAKPVSILRPLIQDCHVLGHPGIKREFEEREAAAAAKKAAAAAAVAAMAAAAAAVAQAAATAGKETETTAADGQAASDDSRDASNQDSSSPSSSSSVASSSSVSSSSSSSRSTIEIRHSYLPGSYCNQGFLMDQQQRRDLPALNQPQLKRTSSEEENEAVPPSASRLHFVCLRPQPGEAKIARLRLLEKGRQEATLAMFGHTSKGQGPPKANLSLLLSSKRSPIDSATFTALKQPVKTSEVAPSHHRVLRQKPASLVVPQAKQPSKKPTRFLRICLTGSASKLLCQDKKPTATEKLGKEQQRGIAAAAGSGKKLLKETQINNVSHNHQTDSNLKVVEQNIFKRQINGSGIASCKMCSKRYKVSSPLKSWKEALEASNKAIFCDKCRPLAEQQHRRKEEAAAAALAAAAKKLRETATDNRYKCDICNKVFSKRSNMIRHMTNNHPLNIHGVELAKFAAKPAAASAVTAGSSSGSGGNSASYRTSRRQASTVQGTSHLCAETTTPTNSPSKRYVKPLISLA